MDKVSKKVDHNIMTRFADSPLQDDTTPDTLETADATSKPMIDNTAETILGVLFIWFVAPFVAYLCLIGVLGVLLVSMQTLQYFETPPQVALLTSILVTAAATKLVFNAVCRAMRRSSWMQ